MKKEKPKPKPMKPIPVDKLFSNEYFSKIGKDVIVAE
jgi:hypothetical protein